MSKMWERDLKNVSSQIEGILKERDALQDTLDRMLSPTSPVNPVELKAISDLIENNEGLLVTARDRQQAIAYQNRMQDEEELKRIKAPLRPAADRDGFYRSQAARNAAILGILERERRQNAPLSREAWFSRAQSTDARSRSVRPNTAFYQPEKYMYKDKVDPGTGEVLDWMDPCVEYRTQQKMRRAAMAARGLLGKGYSGPRRPSPC